MILRLLIVLCAVLVSSQASADIEEVIAKGTPDEVAGYLGNPDASDMSDAEILYTAAQRGRADIVAFLLKRGIPVNVRGEDNRSALSVAIERGHRDVIELLLAKGAEIDDANGFTVLTDAVGAGNKELVDFLLKKGANINAAFCAGDSCVTPLRLAAQRGNLDLFNYLLERGASPTIALPYDDIDGNLLNSAVYGGNLDIVTALVAKGFNIHDSEKRLKKSLLASAVNSDSMGVLSVVDYLINSGLDVNYKDSFRKTVFFDVWTSPYETAEEKAVKVKVLLKLLDRGLRVDDVDEVGNTPLHHACELGFVEVVRALIAKKAPLGARNTQDETPIDVARKKEETEIVSLLEYAMSKKK
ncbi:MAG: ankyrin repeat domain-containing protein [Desulfovibrionaceae bacterium]|nr:ankyrin repeat domain-containing protein [Desulfovibrionaceae bacterium]